MTAQAQIPGRVDPRQIEPFGTIIKYNTKPTSSKINSGEAFFFSVPQPGEAGACVSC